MVKIDRRKSMQEFTTNKGKRVYCWKQKDKWQVGVNGTGNHFTRPLHLWGEIELIINNLIEQH